MIVFSVFCCVIVAVCMLFIGRFFPQIYNTSEEIDLFCEGLHRVAKMFKLA